MPDAKSQIGTHRLTGPNGSTIVKKALRILRPNLPVSLPIYRRLQFGRFFDAATILTNLALLDQAPDGSQQQWLIAFVDRTRRPETELWMFASWEMLPIDHTPSPETQRQQDELMLSLARSIKALGVPQSLHQDLIDAEKAELSNDSEKDHSGASRADYSAHMLDPSIMLCGAVHENTAPALQRTGLIKQVFTAGLVRTHTYVFKADRYSLPTPPPLPENLQWGELRYEHFALVRSRTQIPRQDKTLAMLPQVAIFTTETSEPVGWAFVGLDGSLTTLHVEREWRGRGLAKAISVKLFTEKMDFLWEEGVQRLAHGFVIKGNEASSRVCGSLGGKKDWDVFWVRLDLGVVGDAV